MTRDNVSISEDFINETGDDDVNDGKVRIVPFAIATPDSYEALCLPAASLAVFIEEQSLNRKVGMIALAFGPEMGLYVPMVPAHLRTFASQVLSMADEIDGGKGKQ